MSAKRNNNKQINEDAKSKQNGKQNGADATKTKVNSQDKDDSNDNPDINLNDEKKQQQDLDTLSNGIITSNGNSSPLVMGTAANGTNDETASIGGVKDEEEEDEDEDEKMELMNGGDPERFKAFNMFVRLFVDENLDRQVPISKQPKEKIQAIIDSCIRQFPDYAGRARKRIRTYLKSCRRKRTREQAGLDTGSGRSSVHHLNSVQSEQLLAKACENEAENAKRMRMGMEPVSQPLPTPGVVTAPLDTTAATSIVTSTAVTPGGITPVIAGTGGIAIGANSLNGTTAIVNGLNNVNGLNGAESKQLKTEYKSEQLATLLTTGERPPLATQTISAGIVPAISGVAPVLPAASLAGNPPVPVSFTLSANGLINPATLTSATNPIFRPGFPAVANISPQPATQALTLTPTLAAPITTAAGMAAYPGTQTLLAQHNQIFQNGSLAVNPASRLTPAGTVTSVAAPTPTPGIATAAAMAAATQIGGTANASALLNHKLNTTEMAAVRQLITGYRESAAFLLRSADELENLLTLQTKLN